MAVRDLYYFQTGYAHPEALSRSRAQLSLRRVRLVIAHCGHHVPALILIGRDSQTWPRWHCQVNLVRRP
ncbi:hypothetical protein F3J12_00570 [Burkholderia sp. Ax-1735]|nr:hypothetical protein [Burkholderia sp. Ap-955]NIF08074.1 hypothetical protein [Burkholderia sp. Ax-1735]NIG02078.1 hypothetical protein [Burkholderia sp. Tr-849]